MFDGYLVQEVMQNINRMHNYYKNFYYFQHNHSLFCKKKTCSFKYIVFNFKTGPGKTKKLRKLLRANQCEEYILKPKHNSCSCAHERRCTNKLVINFVCFCCKQACYESEYLLTLTLAIKKFIFLEMMLYVQEMKDSD
jgi:hypothetical protein